jgi:class 3 adenylate cyclase
LKEDKSNSKTPFQNEQEDVIILFCYISDFPRLVRIQKENIFYTLQSLYNCIDKLCEKHGIQKVEVIFFFQNIFIISFFKTVGNNYVACTGIKAYDGNLKQVFMKDKCERMIDLAFDLIDEVSSRTYGRDEENEVLKVQVGIHGGKVISDIIGFHKVQFSLFGDPVNTTSRIASNARECTVTISEQVYQKMKTHSEFKFEDYQIDVEPFFFNIDFLQFLCLAGRGFIII